MVTSLTVSPMSYNLPSVNVIGSSEALVALDFFLDPPFSSSLGHLMRVDISRGSAPCCSVSSSFVLGEGDHAPLSEPYSVPLVYFLVSFLACSAWAFSTVSFFLFSTSCAIFSLVSSFFFYAVNFLPPTTKFMVVCHSTGHWLSTTTMALSIVRYNKLYHFCVGSLCALMDTRWKSTLNSA